MTANQIAYQAMLENRRANKAKERENERHQKTVEIETQRHDLETERLGLLNFGETSRSNRAKEAIQINELGEERRANLAREAENYRSNLARESENYRSNKEKEALQYASIMNDYEIRSAQNTLRSEELGLDKWKAEQDVSIRDAQNFMRGRELNLSARETEVAEKRYKLEERIENFKLLISAANAVQSQLDKIVGKGDMSSSQILALLGGM